MERDGELRKLFVAIATGDRGAVEKLLRDAPELAVASSTTGATRTDSSEHFLGAIRRYIVEGDTALHIAAAAYDSTLVRALLSMGAAVGAKNRLGDEPLHSAAVGSPGSSWWNPQAQAETIRALVWAGADANARDKFGVAPLHKAVRTRCSAAVKTLLECGADAAIKNRNGSDALALASRTTGRPESGSAEARAEQEIILRTLHEAITSNSK